MQLRKLIADRMSVGPIHLYDRHGQYLSAEEVRKEYAAIRAYLLNEVTEGIIAIKATKDYRFLLTVLAALEVGLPYISMMADYPQDRIEQIREDSQFRLLLTDEMLAQICAHPQECRKDLPDLTPEQAAYILFTSGSTGKPKGVMIPRKALENFVQWAGDEFKHVTEEDHLLQVTEFTFDIVLTDVALFLTKNLHVHFSDFRSDFFRLAFEIESNKITTLSTVPNNLSMLLSDVMTDRVDLSSLNTLMIAGARFSYGLYQKCSKRLGKSVNLYNLYGPTESTVYSHQKKMNFVEEQDCSGNNIAIGKTLPNVTALIIKDGVIQGAGQEGELLLGGVQLLSKYMNDPERTAAVLVEVNGETYYRTGDIAYQDERGDYYVIGRLDDTIKVRGFRINLLDIDSYIHRLPYIEDCATIAVPHEIAENQTVAFMRIKETKPVKQIKKDLLEFLLDYQIPEKIIQVENYPVNSSGKICRKTLKENYLNSLKKQALS